MERSEASRNELPIIVVAGPTASGKSKAALDIAEAFDGAVVNADSMQVYRELRILTARPILDDLAGVPHYLYGALPAAEPCSAGRWLGLARRAIAEIRAMGRLPVVAGGTGLYLKALTEGLAPVPEIAEGFRTEARRLHADLGGEAFRARLADLDAHAAEHLPPTDAQRLIRAYEVVRGTGRTLADWQRDEPTDEPSVPGRFATIVLVPPREALYAAIDARFEAMMNAGAVDEVRALIALGLDAELPAMKALGVRELAGYVAGTASLEEAVESAQRASRRYAKRQFTWLRHQMAGAHVVPAQYSESKKQKIFAFIRQFLLTEQS